MSDLSNSEFAKTSVDAVLQNQMHLFTFLLKYVVIVDLIASLKHFLFPLVRLCLILHLESIYNSLFVSLYTVSREDFK